MMAMLGYERLTGEEKVRRAVRAAWFEMPQAWVDALRAMPAEVKLTNANSLWLQARDMLYFQGLERGLREREAWRAAIQRLMRDD
jgi:hypothetical protein